MCSRELVQFARSLKCHLKMNKKKVVIKNIFIHKRNDRPSLFRKKEIYCKNEIDEMDNNVLMCLV